MVQRYCKETQEGSRYHIFGFKDKVDVIEEAGVQKAPEMVNKIENNWILQYGNVINVRAEGNISIDDDNLPALENILASDSAEQSIFKKSLDKMGCATGVRISEGTQDQSYSRSLQVT